MPVIAVCSLKSGGSSTLALALASVAAAGGQAVELVDASRNGDLWRWASLRGRPDCLSVSPCRTVPEMERLIRNGLKRRALVIVDAGTKRERVRMAARFADISLIPVRFSPLSAFWAAETDRLLREEAMVGRPRRHAFVATAVTQIPSRIARTVEAGLECAAADRLPAGLALRAAFEAPFLSGGTIFSLSDEAAPGLGKARGDALAVANAIGVGIWPPRRLPELAADEDAPPWRFAVPPHLDVARLVAADSRHRIEIA